MQFLSSNKGSIDLEKPLTDLGSGLFSFDITQAESNQFEDDSYSCTISAGEDTLKNSFVRWT